MIFGDFEVEKDGAIYDISTLEFVTTDKYQLENLEKAIIEAKKIYANSVKEVEVKE